MIKIKYEKVNIKLKHIWSRKKTPWIIEMLAKC